MQRSEPQYTQHVRDAPRPELVYAPSLTAAEVVAGLEPGGSLRILSHGQFSLMQLVRAVIEITGPADVSITSWSVGPKDIETVAALLEGEEIRAYRMLVSHRWLSLKPQSVARMLHLFGDSAVVVCDCHAKVATVRNEEWDVAIHGSANMNENPRLEQFTVEESEDVCDFFDDAITELQTLGEGSVRFTKAESRRLFQQALSAESDRDALLELLGEDVVRRRDRAMVKERTQAEARQRLFGTRSPSAAEGPVVPSVQEGAAQPVQSVTASMTQEQFLVWKLAALELAVLRGEAGSVAYTQTLKELEGVHARLLEARTADEGEEDASDLSQEEWDARVQEDAARAPDADLEWYMQEWCRRRRVRVVVEPGGLLRLMRNAAV